MRLSTRSWAVLSIASVILAVGVGVWAVGAHSASPVSTPVPVATVTGRPGPPTATPSATAIPSTPVPIPPGSNSITGDNGCYPNPACTGGSTPGPQPPAAFIANTAKAQQMIVDYATYDSSAGTPAWAASYASLTDGKTLALPTASRQGPNRLGMVSQTSLVNNTQHPLIVTIGNVSPDGNWVYQGTGTIRAVYTQFGKTTYWVLNGTWTVTMSGSGDHPVTGVIDQFPTLQEAFPNG